ncbi:TolB family protein [Actinoplanes sp. NPDC051859]|uniref:TolB family protein n=1 Tax=Actinoplanes sp. NPDC051859 TaxID=3363909 RepID=UPI0037A0B00E
MKFDNWARRAVPAGVALTVLATAVPAAAAEAPTELISIASSGAQGAGHGIKYTLPQVSGDGRFVAFRSAATDIVPGDGNGTTDIFLRDRSFKETTLVSVASNGRQANGWSDGATLNADGRYVAFRSAADNLTPGGDTNDVPDIFVRDRVSERTTMVSRPAAGGQANDQSIDPSISADGRFIAFTSLADNLVPGDANLSDVFVRDMQTGTVTLASVSNTGEQANGNAGEPKISADGRYVTFRSRATNLVAGDTNGRLDVFVRDLQAGTTTRVNVATGGAQSKAEATVSSAVMAGRYVTFWSDADDLVPEDTNKAGDVFVRDLQDGTTSRVSVSSTGGQSESESWSPVISGDGRYVAFVSAARNLGGHDWGRPMSRLYVHDRLTGATRQGNLTNSGAPANGADRSPAISADGSTVVYESGSTNLVDGYVANSWNAFSTRISAITGS